MLNSVTMRAVQPQIARHAEQAPQPEVHTAKLGSVGDFYDRFEAPINIGGGALLGAALARACGVPGEVALSAAGIGALAGFFTDGRTQAACTAGGAVLGGAIATLAGVPGPAILSACGTGALVGWFAGTFNND